MIYCFQPAKKVWQSSNTILWLLCLLSPCILLFAARFLNKLAKPAPAVNPAEISHVGISHRIAAFKGCVLEVASLMKLSHDLNLESFCISFRQLWPSSKIFYRAQTSFLLLMLSLEDVGTLQQCPCWSAVLVGRSVVPETIARNVQSEVYLCLILVGTD